MAFPITIPRLGWNMEEGIFHGWLKKDGDVVRAGDMLFRLESEKATEDIECHENGILRIAANAPAEGDTVAVGMSIGHLLHPGEKDAPPVEATQPADLPGAGSPVAARLNKPITHAPKSVVASPRARRLAASLGIDWAHLSGTGRTGRIRERDIRAAAEATQEVHGGTVVPMSSLRQAIAQRLMKSRQSTVPVTLTTTSDVSELVRMRQELKACQGADAPSINDFFVLATAHALIQHPTLGAKRSGTNLVMPREINIGIAVDAKAALLVPVITHASTKTIEQIAADSRQLIARARQGTLTTNDLRGGIFTVTNLGMYGVDSFTPVINYPECAILGIGRIRRVPIFAGDQVAAREQVMLSLTFDHALVDGAPAARFLQTLVNAIENPRRLIDHQAIPGICKGQTTAEGGHAM